MARSLLLVCLWAVVLLVVIEKCAGVDDPPLEERPSSPEEKTQEDSTTSKTTTEATPSSREEKTQEDSTTSKTTTEATPSSPEEKTQEDSTTSKTTTEATPSSLEKKTQEDSTTSKSTTEATPSPPEKKPQEDSTTRKGTTEATPSPPEEKPQEESSTSKDTAEATTSPPEIKPQKDSTAGKVTSEQESPTTKAVTAPSPPTSDDKKDLCERKLDECKNGKKTSCKVINGTATCVCPPSMKENNGDCFVANKVTVKFTLKPRKKRSITYSVDEECSENKTVLIQAIKEKVPNAIEESIVCIGDDVTFDVFAENEKEKEETGQIFRACMQRDCELGLGIKIAANSAKVEAKDMCEEEETKKLAEQMGMTCQFNSTTKMLCNKEKTTPIGKANVQGIPFEICRALPCNQTCKNEKMRCVQESCICKPQYKFEDGECKSVCELKTSVCPSGATCVIGQGDQSFYCECPPKLTGPLCTRENKPLQTAKLNIVVVGVVLASLLLLCFVISASIISRLRKKAQGPSFSKDCERRPQRELRGYDGPYKASDPASLHRGRDHTSL